MTGVMVKLITVTARSSGGLVIPMSCVYYNKGDAYVYTVKDSVAVMTPVVLGIVSGDMAEVLSGIDESSDIVTTWNPNIADGAAVEASQEG
jgi:multidrug efflux pump subunit AcrA (membrane-fusion protein)